MVLGQGQCWGWPELCLPFFCSVRFSHTQQHSSYGLPLSSGMGSCFGDLILASLHQCEKFIVFSMVHPLSFTTYKELALASEILLKGSMQGKLCINLTNPRDHDKGSCPLAIDLNHLLPNQVFFIEESGSTPTVLFQWLKTLPLQTMHFILCVSQDNHKQTLLSFPELSVQASCPATTWGEMQVYLNHYIILIKPQEI